MTSTLNYLRSCQAAGCPRDQVENFLRAGLILQPRQLLASAMARRCDLPDGPTSIAYGGARGGGKSFWLLAQVGADDCQRWPGLKCLLLRKVGKANLEHFEDLRRHLFTRLPHEFSAYRGVLTFQNGSKIVAGHFQCEADIDKYLGLEYDVIAIEEATTLTSRKYTDIATCCRSSKGWRPRIYSTSNPGGIGHAWYKARFIVPWQQQREADTRYIPATVADNRFNNPEYAKVLQGLHGWQRRAWLDGDWDIAAGQFFSAFRRDAHVISDFDPSRAVEWFASFDYGYTHYTVFLLGCTDGDGNLFVVDEHAERLWLPQRHAAAIRALLSRHNLSLRKKASDLRPSDFSSPAHSTSAVELRPPDFSPASALSSRVFAGTDVFSRQSDGTTIASQYARLGLHLRPANTDRINGWAEILNRLGDPAAGIPARLFIHERCRRLIETLPALQHDPNRPEDVLKVDCDEEGIGGDDAADALRYLVATRLKNVTQRKLAGL